MVVAHLGHVLADARPQLSARAWLVGRGDVDLDATPRLCASWRSEEANRLPTEIAERGRFRIGAAGWDQVSSRCSNEPNPSVPSCVRSADECVGGSLAR